MTTSGISEHNPERDRYTGDASLVAEDVLGDFMNPDVPDDALMLVGGVAVIDAEWLVAYLGSVEVVIDDEKAEAVMSVFDQLNDSEASDG